MAPQGFTSVDLLASLRDPVQECRAGGRSSCPETARRPPPTNAARRSRRGSLGTSSSVPAFRAVRRWGVVVGWSATTTQLDITARAAPRIVSSLCGQSGYACESLQEVFGSRRLRYSEIGAADVFFGGVASDFQLVINSDAKALTALGDRQRDSQVVQTSSTLRIYIREAAARSFRNHRTAPRP